MAVEVEGGLLRDRLIQHFERETCLLHVIKMTKYIRAVQIHHYKTEALLLVEELHVSGVSDWEGWKLRTGNILYEDRFVVVAVVDAHRAFGICREAVLPLGVVLDAHLVDVQREDEGREVAFPLELPAGSGAAFLHAGDRVLESRASYCDGDGHVEDSDVLHELLSAGRPERLCAGVAQPLLALGLLLRLAWCMVEVFSFHQRNLEFLS